MAPQAVQDGWLTPSILNSHIRVAGAGCVFVYLRACRGTCFSELRFLLLMFCAMLLVCVFRVS